MTNKSRHIPLPLQISHHLRPEHSAGRQSKQTLYPQIKRGYHVRMKQYKLHVGYFEGKIRHWLICAFFCKNPYAAI